MTKNIGVDWPNFRTHGFLKKICLQTVCRSPAATKVTRNREFNPNHITLHVGTNERKSSKTASQISRSVIDLALSLKSEANAVTISLIVPRKDNLNNKAQEVNSRLINMCGERDIAFIEHTDTIDTERHLNESKVHLNKSGTIEFAKNVFEFLLQQD